MLVLAFLLPKVSSAFFPTTLTCPPFFHSRRHFAWFLSPVCFSSLETEPCLPSSALRKKLTRTRVNQEALPLHPRHLDKIPITRYYDKQKFMKLLFMQQLSTNHQEAQ